MATLTLNDNTLQIELSLLEKLGAFRASLSIPRASITRASVAHTWRDVLEGMRAPGTGLPPFVMLGTWRGLTWKDFVAIYRGAPILVVELQGESWRRVLVSTQDAETLCARILTSG